MGKKKKKNLYKFIKKELTILNQGLEEINKREKNFLFKSYFIKKTRDEYFNTYIKPLMLIYQASKNP